jgi:hypothetical protein
MVRKKIVLSPLRHRDGDHIAILFAHDTELARIVKGIAGRAYSSTHRCWYVPVLVGLEQVTRFLEYQGVDVDRTAFELAPTSSRPTTSANPHLTQGAAHNTSPITDDAIASIRMMEQKLHLLGYSKNTVKTYCEQFGLFLRFFSPASAMDLEEPDIRNYLLYLVEKKKLSKSTQGQAINAIKFFYEKVLRQERKVYYLERPMRDRVLPTVLNEREVLALFEAVKNMKHRLMLMIIYAAGLRRSELLEISGMLTTSFRGKVTTES